MNEHESPDSKQPHAAAPGRDKVGYGRPPKHTQFKKGQSGNPKGRPKGKLNLKSDLQNVYTEHTVITEGGKRCRTSYLVAIAKLERHRALKGDARATDGAFKRAKALGLLDQTPDGIADEAMKDGASAAKEMQKKEVEAKELIEALSDDDLDTMLAQAKIANQLKSASGVQSLQRQTDISA